MGAEAHPIQILPQSLQFLKPPIIIVDFLLLHLLLELQAGVFLDLLEVFLVLRGAVLLAAAALNVAEDGGGNATEVVDALLLLLEPILLSRIFAAPAFN